MLISGNYYMIDNAMFKFYFQYDYSDDEYCYSTISYCYIVKKDKIEFLSGRYLKVHNFKNIDIKVFVEKLPNNHVFKINYVRKEKIKKLLCL